MAWDHTNGQPNRRKEQGGSNDSRLKNDSDDQTNETLSYTTCKRTFDDLVNGFGKTGKLDTVAVTTRYGKRLASNGLGMRLLLGNLTSEQ